MRLNAYPQALKRGFKAWGYERCSQNGNARRIENRGRKSRTEKENRIEFTKTKIRAAFKSYMTVGALILAVL